MSDERRARLKADVDEAYKLQMRAGIKGAAQFTAVGIGAVSLGHYTWPLFRKQTFAFKAFLVSAFTMFGLVVTADTVLLQHEAKRRAEAGALRKEARIELGRRGIIPTETALREWQEEKERNTATARESA